MLLSFKKEDSSSPSADAGLDWLNFFTANLQTAFGPFIAVYLTDEAWTQGDIGLALGVGSVAGMLAQVPAGVLVDATVHKARAAGAAILAIIAGALTLALAPTKLPVLTAQISHAFASCMLSPAIAAMSLDHVGHRPGAVGERLGRNARFASIGNGTAAGLMAVAGYRLGPRAVFFLGAALAVPGLFALRSVARSEEDRRTGRTEPTEPPPGPGGDHATIWDLLRDRRLLWFAAVCVLFHLSNGFMLPLAAGEATRSLGSSASLVIGACIVGPQVVVAALSPAVGRLAERWGRRPVLVVGLLALPARGMALAAVVGGTILPVWLLIPVQLLDGISGASFGVLLPLVAADISRGTGRFNLCMGVLGLAVGGAASASSLVAGSLADVSVTLAFACLSAAGAIGALVAYWMPETRRTAP